MADRKAELERKKKRLEEIRAAKQAKVSTSTSTDTSNNAIDHLDSPFGPSAASKQPALSITTCPSTKSDSSKTDSSFRLREAELERKKKRLEEIRAAKSSGISPQY